MLDLQLQEGEVLDDLLIDDLKIIQNVNLYRFTSDSVLLSRFARAKAHDLVADFCAGSGIVGLHFYALHPALVERVVFFEMQTELFEMSKKTIRLNGLEEKFTAVNCKIQSVPSEFTEKFSLILCNPPYEKGGFENKDAKKAACRKELFLSLDELAEGMGRCVKFGGRAALCHRADRMADLVCAFRQRGLEPKRMQFVAGKAGDSPYLVLLECVKGGKPGLKVLPTIVN